eukprot:275344_1
MAEELLFLGALLDAQNRANNAEDQQMDKESENWVVPCTKCDARMKRMKGYQTYNTSPDSTILCDGCRRKIPGRKTMFHCPKNQNLFHLNGFDFCLDCAGKHRVQSQVNNNNNDYQQPQSYNNNNNQNNNYHSSPYQSPPPSNSNINSAQGLRETITEQRRMIDRLKNENKQQREDNLRYKNELNDEIRKLRNERDNLFRDKRELNNHINDKSDIIDQQKERITNLKHLVQTSSDMNNSKGQSLQFDVERLQKEKLECQRKYRSIKQELDDKLDIIEQFKENIEKLKNEKKEIINNFNNETPGTGKKNEIS